MGGAEEITGKMPVSSGLLSRQPRPHRTLYLPLSREPSSGGRGGNQGVKV